jgi:phosphatidate cytidylyltransferase
MVFAALILPVTVLAMLETSRIARAMQLPVNTFMATVFTLLVMAKYAPAGLLDQYRAYLPGYLPLTILFVLALMLMLLFDRNRERAVKSALITPGAAALVLLVLLPLARIYFEFGSMLFLVLVLCTKASDTGGYIFGMLSNKFMKNGNHKIVPSISPKKSWEGTVGAAIFSIVTALLLVRFECITMNVAETVIFGFCAFLGSFAGDLTESQLKRAAGIKDSANWIPGMGGILDVLDSFIYNAPIFYLALKSGVLVCQ